MTRHTCLTALSALLATVCIVAPAPADFVQVFNDSVPAMALTNTSSSTSSGLPQMQTNNRFISQKWTREFSSAVGGGFFLRSVSSTSLCLRDRVSSLPTASVRRSTCNSPAAELSWQLTSTRHPKNVATGRVIAVLGSSSPFFAGIQMQPWTNVAAKRWTIRPCATIAC